MVAASRPLVAPRLAPLRAVIPPPKKATGGITPLAPRDPLVRLGKSPRNAVGGVIPWVIPRARVYLAPVGPVRRRAKRRADAALAGYPASQGAAGWVTLGAAAGRPATRGGFRPKPKKAGAGRELSRQEWGRLLLARADPAGWIKAHLGTTLSQNGVQIVEAVRDHPRTAVKAAHSISKSFTGARLAIWWLHAYPGSVVLTTAPTFNQVKNILWREIASAYEGRQEPLFGRILAGTQVQIAPKWYALGFKAADSQTARFQGFHSPYLLVIVDEANGVSSAVVEALISTLSSGHTRLLLIGNPVEPQGEFFEAFRGKSHLYKTMTVSAFDTPNFTLHGIETIEQVLAMSPAQLARAEKYPFLTTPRWVKEVILEHGADSQYVASRVLATFPSSTPDALIPLGWVEAAKRLEGEIDEGAPLIAGLDIADEGLNGDETALCIRRGRHVLKEYAWTGKDPMASLAYAAKLLEPFGLLAALRMDVIGIGKGVFSRARELDLPAVPIDVREATKSTKGDYPDRRAELWGGLRERLRREDAILGVVTDAAGRVISEGISERTVGQLTTIKALWKSGYRFPAVERKEDLRKRGLRSPDRAEALLFAFADDAAVRLGDVDEHLVAGSTLGQHLAPDGSLPRW